MALMLDTGAAQPRRATARVAALGLIAEVNRTEPGGRAERPEARYRPRGGLGGALRSTIPRPAVTFSIVGIGNIGSSRGCAAGGAAS